MGEPNFVYETSDGDEIPGTFDSLRRLAVALLLGSFDMLQAAAACDMLDGETTEPARARALEAGIAVCYARAFTMSTLTRVPEEFAPRAGTPERELHDTLMTLRHKVYAHTDEESGRVIERVTRTIDGDVATLAYQESWHPLDRDLLNPIRDLCTNQVEKFRLEATRILGALDRAKGSPPQD